MSAEFYYLIYSMTLNPCTMTKDAEAKALETWLCSECAHIKPEFTAIDITIQEKEPEDTPLNLIQGARLGIARKDFLLALGEETVRRDLYLGRLFDPDGKLLNNWVTFHGRKKLIVRGSKHVTYRKCQRCGEHVYFAMGEKYLYPQPPGDAKIFDDGGGIVLTEEIFEQIRPNLKRWRKLAVDKLPVLTKPNDKLPKLELA